MHETVPHHDLVHSVLEWSALDWWPPVGWWPEPARDLPPAVSPTQAATFVLPPKADSVHSARSFATGTLTGWELGEMCDGMELVVSELATNALRHGLEIGHRHRREVIRLALIRRGGFVTCALTDPGSATPVMREANPFEPGGLGLHIVESISVRWGWSPLAPHGKAVWAVLN